jgi:hypothetical protein
MWHFSDHTPVYEVATPLRISPRTGTKKIPEAKAIRNFKSENYVAK